MEEKTVLTPEALKAEGDRKWIEALPPVLRQIAERHGRELFEFVLNVNAINVALPAIQSQGRGNRKIEGMLQVLSGAVQNLSVLVFAAKGWTDKDFYECKTDLDRVAMIQEGARKEEEEQTEGGLILPAGMRRH